MLIVPSVSSAARYLPVYCKGSNSFNTVEIQGAYDDVALRATDTFVVSQTGSSGSKTIRFPADQLRVTRSGSKIVIQNAWILPEIGSMEISGAQGSANDGNGRVIVSTTDMSIRLAICNANCMF